MHQDVNLKARVPGDMAGDRLDQIAAHLFPDYSRSRLQQWIKSGELTVDENRKKAKDKLYGGELLEVKARLVVLDEHEPQQVDFELVHEDDHLLVVNKPVGLVTHPAPGNRDRTLLNGLLYRFPELELIPRAGIVHRLDKDTSGLMVVARTLASQNHLVNQLQLRSVTRLYEAIVYGVILHSSTIEQPIGRHPANRKKMAIRPDGKEAITHYRVIRAYRQHTHLEIKLETGRTHQIRVHMASLRHPLVGDPAYGGTVRIPSKGSAQLKALVSAFGRQALHARQLVLDHPYSGERVSWKTELPEDMRALIDALDESEATQP
jgi:23S rRNA pseudouridine1911/1915/1917 synthase